MAIDRGKYKAMLNGFEELFETILQDINPNLHDLIQKKILEPAINELERYLDESRPPKLMLIGRSGHGKSSIINALSGKHIAQIDDITPTTPRTTRYTIVFENNFATWDVFDTRGIFETTTPDGAATNDSISVLIDDIEKYQPDVLIHVVSAPEAKCLERDFEAIEEIYSKIDNTLKDSMPVITIMNKVDTLGNPREWPPEKFARKAGNISDLVEYTKRFECFKNLEHKAIDPNAPHKGYTLAGGRYVGVIPVCSIEDENERWNLETLYDFVGNRLPESATLDYFQAIRRKSGMRNISSSWIKKFSGIAGVIGASPIPIADIVVLTPLQILMISFVGALSCRPLSKETAFEYFTASGANVAVAFAAKQGARKLLQQVVKFIPIPVVGSVVSGSIAAAATYSLGKAAEAYFFAGDIVNQDAYLNDWKE